MAFDRIYGPYQTAGIKITTAGKSTVNNPDGTDAYAQTVSLLGVDGATIATNANPVPTRLGTASTPSIVSGAPADVAVSITRPNDTSAYTAGDVVGSATGSTAALTFTAVGANGSAVMVTSVELEIDISAVPSGMTSFTLYLYNVTPPSAYGDNAAWDLPSGDRASFLGSISLGTPVDLGSTLYVRQTGVNTQIKLSGTSVFAYLVTNGGYTPAAQSVFKVTLHSIQL